MAPNPPFGTVTFLFTDIEGSAAIAQEHPDTWESIRARHHAILRAAIESNNGHLFQAVGDASCSAFYTVRDALNAAVEAQQQLRAEPWDAVPLLVRMGIHTGEAQPLEGDYRGYLTLTRVQRVMSTAYGGQILLSDSSAALLHAELSGAVSLIDLGQHRLKSLPNLEHLWQAVSPGLRQNFPPLESLQRIPNNLPVQLTSFLGRETEIADVRKLLETHRLVTLTGAGGTGKTRLAQQAAAQVLDGFKDGVWFIELAPISESALVASAVASVLGVREVQSRPLLADLLEWLGAKELLLLLDNCEHLIGSCAGFADAALRASRTIRILATSREALGIAGEAAYYVPSLESPLLADASHMAVEDLAQYPAVRLFTERARDSLGKFSVTPVNAHAIAQICARLDGIPLAIELAAARMKVLRAEQIAERLDDRFRLLTGGSRTALPRHQTLRSLIDWSYSLLTGPQQMLLRRLSAFAGGWTLEAAEQVCAGDPLKSGEILDLLAHLVDKSLTGLDETSAEPRYRMLETIREYARERLSESGEGRLVRERHLEFLLSLAETAWTHGHSSKEGTWHDRLEREIDNLRAALECAMSQDDAQAALGLAGSLYWFWWTRGYWHEARRWLSGALAKPGATSPTRARARALVATGWFLAMAGDFAQARGRFDESVAIGRALRDKQSLVESLTTMGLITSLGDHAAARGALEEGLALSRELAYVHGIARCLLGIGNIRSSEGHYDEAQACLEESARLFRESGDLNTLAFAVRLLGYIALRRGDFRQATAFAVESLHLNVQTGDRRGIAASLAAIASIAALRGQAGRAARLYGATAALLGSFGAQLIPTDQEASDPYVRDTRVLLTEAEYAAAFAEGSAMEMDEAIAYGMEADEGVGY